MDVKALARCGVVKEYVIDEYICVEMDKGNTAFLLLSGTADVTLKAYRDKKNLMINAKQVSFRPQFLRDKEPAIAKLEPGMIFGEMSLLESKERTASVVVTSDTATVLILDALNFLNVLQTDGDVAYMLFKSLLYRVDKSIKMMEERGAYGAASAKANERYEAIEKLSKDEFISLVKNRPSEAMEILTFLSKTITGIDNDISHMLGK